MIVTCDKHHDRKSAMSYNQHCSTFLAILKICSTGAEEQGACMSVSVCMCACTCTSKYFKVLGSTSLNLLAFKYGTSTWSFF